MLDKRITARPTPMPHGGKVPLSFIFMGGGDYFPIGDLLLVYRLLYKKKKLEIPIQTSRQVDKTKEQLDEIHFVLLMS